MSDFLELILKVFDIFLSRLYLFILIIDQIPLVTNVVYMTQPPVVIDSHTCI